VKNRSKILILFAIALLAFCALIVLNLWVRSPAPRNVKLADCKSSESNFTEMLPAGTMYQIVLGVPKSSRTPPAFSGDIVIRRFGSVIEAYHFGSDDMQECNWLHDAPELQGYTLTWRHNREPDFSAPLKEKTAYDFKISFTKMPPPGSNLWLSWLGF
jgi:hypothetical protein